MHGSKPNLWIVAAKWELECGGSVENCRALFLRAIKTFPHNTSLWLEYFRAELLFAERLWKRLKILSSSDLEATLLEYVPLFYDLNS